MPNDYLPLFVKIATGGVPHDRREELRVIWEAISRTATELEMLAPDGSGEGIAVPELAQILLSEAAARVESVLESKLSGRPHIVNALKNDSALYQALGVAEPRAGD